MALAIGFIRRTVAKHIKSLQEKGIIKRVGPNGMETVYMREIHKLGKSLYQEAKMNISHSWHKRTADSQTKSTS